MAKLSPEDLRFFRERSPAEVIAEAVLGLRGATREEAARALAELVADRPRLVEVLAALPGAAVAALEVIARAGRPLLESEIVRCLDGELGAGKGEAALRALHGRGFLGTSARGGDLGVWPPFIGPVLEVLEGAELLPVPEPASAGGVRPDRGALAIALLLGELARRRPRLTMHGLLHKQDAAELDRLFADALGPGAAELFVDAFSRMGLTAYERSPALARIAVEHAATAAFLARPRRERVLAFARARALPRWLGLAFGARDGVAPRAALVRAARSGLRWQADPGEPERWLGYCVAAGVLDELGPGLRASPEVRGADGPARPEAGRWLVQPNLEVMVPPDVAPAEAFRLACVAEVAAIDRAAVLRLTPASLARAPDSGLDADGVVALLAGRSAAPLPDLAVRAVRDALRIPRIARAYDGVVVTVPPEVASELRGRRDVDALVRLELAPGVFLLAEGAQARFAKAIAAAGGELRTSGEVRSFSTCAGQDELGASALARLVERAPVPPPDARIAAARARARAGEAAEFAAIVPPGSAVPASAPRAGDLGAKLAELEALCALAGGVKA